MVILLFRPLNGVTADKSSTANRLTDQVFRLTYKNSAGSYLKPIT